MHPAFSDQQRSDIIEHVLTEVSKGRAVSRICAEDEQACSYAHFMKWKRDDPDLAANLADAREDGASKLLEEVVAISDDKNEDAQSRKVRIYAREKYAAMIAPQRFGNRVDVTSGGKPLEAAPPVSLVFDQRVQALFTLAAQRAAGLLAAPASLDDDVMS